MVITPAIEGWTLVVGPWCWLPLLQKAGPLTDLCTTLGARYGKAQAYFHSEQGDGEDWLIAEDGHVIRRWIDEHPELALGNPFGIERHVLDAYGIPGKPEDLDPDDDKLSEWTAAWRNDCLATTVAAESSVDPTVIGPTTKVSGLMLVDHAPAIDYQRQ